MYSVFQLQRSGQQWLEDSGAVLLTWLLVNPNGPTLNCIGLRDTQARGWHEVFFRWMHFLGGEDYALGYVDTGSSSWQQDLEQILAHAVSLEVGQELRRFPVVTCIPSALRSTVTANEGWDLKFRRLFSQARAFRLSDWGQERYLLNRYGARFFERAGWETRHAYEEMMAQCPDDSRREALDWLARTWGRRDGWNDWMPGSFQPRHLADGDVELWWAMASDPDYSAAAAAQFAQMWVGAPTLCTLATVTSFDEVRDFLAQYQHPLWPQDLTTAAIRDSLGLT